MHAKSELACLAIPSVGTQYNRYYAIPIASPDIGLVYLGCICNYDLKYLQQKCIKPKHIEIIMSYKKKVLKFN